MFDKVNVPVLGLIENMSYFISPSDGNATTSSEAAAATRSQAVTRPVALKFVLDDPDTAHRDCSSLRCIVYGASPISERVLHSALQAFPNCRFVQGYGLTESAGTSTFSARRPRPRRTGPPPVAIRRRGRARGRHPDRRPRLGCRSGAR